MNRKTRVRLTAEQKQEAVNKVQAGIAVLEVAYLFNVSETTIRQYVRDAETLKPSGLDDKAVALLAFLESKGITDEVSFITVTNELSAKHAKTIFQKMPLAEQVSWLKSDELVSLLTKVESTKAITVDPNLTDFATPLSQEVNQHEHSIKNNSGTKLSLI